MPDIAAYVNEYIRITRMDDPDRLTPDDLLIGEGWQFTPEQREEVCAALRLRAAEFQRISPEEECRESARILKAVSEWAYKRARKEPCDYHPFPHGDAERSHPDAWPDILSIRKGSALGVAMGLALQMANHVHVNESRLRAGVGLRRVVAKFGVTDEMLSTTFYDLNEEARNDPYWREGDEVAATAIVAYARGESDIPPDVAYSLVQYPTLWKSHASGMPVVWAKKYRKYIQDFTPKHLKQGWAPEMVIALHDLWSNRRDYKYAVERGDEAYVTKLDAKAAPLIKFLTGRGVNVEAALNSMW